MDNSSEIETIRQFIEFYEVHCEEDIAALAQKYPDESRTLYVDYDDVYQFDCDLADDYLSRPNQIQKYAEEALRLYNSAGEVVIDNANVKLHNLPD